MKGVIASLLIVATVLCSCQTNHESNCEVLLSQAKVQTDEGSKEKLFQQAISEAQQSQSNRMQLPRALRAFASFYSLQKRHQDAENCLNRAIEEFDKIKSDPNVQKVYVRQNIDEYVELITALAQEKRAQKKFEESDELYKRALNINSSELGALEERQRIAQAWAEMLRQSGREDDAVDVEIQISSAQLTRRDRNESSEQAIKNFIKGQPQARIELAVARLNGLKEPKDKVSKMVNLLYWSAVCEIAHNRIKKAQECVELIPKSRTKSSSRELEEELLINGLVCDRLNESAKSEAFYREALEKDPDQAIQLLMRTTSALKHYKGGRDAGIQFNLHLLDASKSIEQLNTSNGSALLYNAGDLYSEAHQDEKATPYYTLDWQQSQKQKPLNQNRFVTASIRLARNLKVQHKYIEAKKTLTDSIGLATGLFKGKELNKALAALNTTLTEILYWDQKDFAGVLEPAAQAYKYAQLESMKQPASCALWMRADALRWLKRPGECEKLLLQELQMWEHPSTTNDTSRLEDSLLRLGDFYLEAGRNREAQRAYERHLELAQADPKTCDSMRLCGLLSRLTKALLMQSQTAKAASYAERASKLADDMKYEHPLEYSVSLYSLADVYCMEGKPDTAVPIYLKELEWVQKQEQLKNTHLPQDSMTRLLNAADTYWTMEKKLEAAKCVSTTLTAYEKSTGMQSPDLDKRMQDFAARLRQEKNGELVGYADDIEKRLKARRESRLLTPGEGSSK